MNPMKNNKQPNFEQEALRVSLVSILWNLLLTVFKLLAGVLAHSGAMLSDAVHSASDVISTMIVIIGIKLSARKADRNHPYGHERFECVAAILLAVVLLGIGLGIGLSSVETILDRNNEPLAIPGTLALVAAVVSIGVKEALYRYTKVCANRIGSTALLADAWHHRSDAMSSVGALIGISGAKLGFPILDPAASAVICLFVIKAAYDIFRDAIRKMVDHAWSEEMETSLRQCALNQKGVLGVDLLRTRVFGNVVYVDMEIRADGQVPLKDAHYIAETVHKAIEQNFPKVKHIMVQVNPHIPTSES